MKPAELVADLARRGFALARAGDGIRVCPASALTDDLRQVIRDNKAALLALLRRACPTCRRPLDERQRCWPCRDRLCERCGRLTGTPFISLCLACEAESRRELG
jgi:hypothetical protein